MVRVTDMTHGRPIRLILLFSLPLMLGSVFQQLYTIVDTIIIGRGVGMQALASIGAADWINWLVLWGLQGLRRVLRFSRRRSSARAHTTGCVVYWL